MGLEAVVRRLAGMVVYSDAAERAATFEELDSIDAGYDDVEEYRAAREAEADQATAEARAEADRVEQGRVSESQAKDEEIARLRAELAGRGSTVTSPAAPAPPQAPPGPVAPPFGGDRS